MGIMPSESVSNVSNRKAKISLKNLNILYIKISFFLLIWVLRLAQPANFFYLLWISFSKKKYFWRSGTKVTE